MDRAKNDFNPCNQYHEDVSLFQFSSLSGMEEVLLLD